MIKVAMIGAGSVVFSKNLTGDILSFPEFREATLAYMDVNKERLEVGAALCRKTAAALGAKPKIIATFDRRKALEGADFVINMVQIGGFDSTLVDFEIPRKYGLRFTIADTTGPGGLFRALRTFPMLRGLCRDMEAVCPNALLLNYSNPMSMNMQTVFRTSGIKAVGLCHSVQGTFNQLMGYLKEDPETVDFLCGGINHMAFYLALRKGDEDLYPRLFAAMDDPGIYRTNKVRFELMRRLGYFVTESSEHSAEYNPWFIPHGPDRVERFDIPIDEYLRRCDGAEQVFEKYQRLSQSDEAIPVHRSHEYGSLIIHAIATGTERVIYGNQPNRDLIVSNLPASAIVEAPTRVTSAGLEQLPVGELPPQLVAYMQPHVSQHELFIRAAMEGRRDHVYQACMFDPMAGAVLTPDRAVEMCDELIAAHGDLLPPLTTPMLVPTSGKSFAKVNPGDLRRTWEMQKAIPDTESILEWHVIGPFCGTRQEPINLDTETMIESAMSGGGAVNLMANLQVGGQFLNWRPVSAQNDGYVDLGAFLGKKPWSVAYAYAELLSVHPRDTELRIGSDDGVKVWLNGELVHTSATQERRYVPGEDRIPVRLVGGSNRLLVKINNVIFDWGFSASIPRPTF